MFFYYLDLAWRSVKRTPLISSLMVGAIAVGIGITMTSLSVYYMMSMDPIPHKSDRLHAVQINIMDEGEKWYTKDDLPLQFTYQDAMALYQAELPKRKVAMMRTGFSVHLDNNMTIKPFIEGTRVTGRDFFTLFDIDFIYGDAWSKSQENDAVQVVVISKKVNDKIFGGKNSVGKEIMLDAHRFQIVGVIDDWNIHSKYYDLNDGAFSKPENLFIPLSLLPVLELESWGNVSGWKYEKTKTHNEFLQSEKVWLQFWVELDGTKEKQDYQNFLNNYLTEQAKKGRFKREKPHFSLRDVNEWMAYNGVVSDDNRILVGLSFMFLTVCLANILGLLLGKFLRRAPEIGVRRALGASKAQIFMQHIVEVGLLGLLGGALGIVIAQLGLWGVEKTYSNYSGLASMDITMLLTAPTISIIACVLAGLYPAWLVCRTTSSVYLKTQ